MSFTPEQVAKLTRVIQEGVRRRGRGDDEVVGIDNSERV